VAPSAAAAARPTGITILAILSAIGGVLGLLGGIGLLGLSATVLSGMGALLGLVVIALAVLNLALAWGFWTMQPWAWPLGVGLEIVSIILAVVQYLDRHRGRHPLLPQSADHPVALRPPVALTP